MTQLYEKLRTLSKKASLFQSIHSLLEWDQEIYMPEEAIELRSLERELLASLGHQAKTSDEFKKTLSSLIDLESGEVIQSGLSDQQKAALREWRRDFLRVVKLPKDFVEEFSRVTTMASQAWIEAKEKSSYLIFAPHLQKVIDLSRKKADLLGFEDHPYDALIDSYEPEMKTKVLTTLFERLKIPLIELLKKIETKKAPSNEFLKKNYPKDKQFAFAKKILADMGFDPKQSRLDLSVHPMCVPLHPKDTRMTTRINLHDPISCILSTAHEGGHGLYNRQLPVEHFGTPLCESASLGIDESQSRTWETQIGMSLPYWKHYFPQLQELYPENLKGIHFEEFYKAVNFVKPSLIRTESDEVTYNLHIMLRFDLEKMMLEGKLNVKELPEIWNETMRNYLGITPKADSEGCLQDVHWSFGGIGYFPTYTLGNLYAAQFFETFSKSHPHWDQEVAKGSFHKICDWYKENIHKYGRQYLPEELCKKVTGSPLSEKPFINYLIKKYTQIYHL